MKVWAAILHLSRVFNLGAEHLLWIWESNCWSGQQEVVRFFKKIFFLYLDEMPVNADHIFYNGDKELIPRDQQSLRLLLRLRFPFVRGDGWGDGGRGAVPLSPWASSRSWEVGRGRASPGRFPLGWCSPCPGLSPGADPPAQGLPMPSPGVWGHRSPRAQARCLSPSSAFPPPFLLLKPNGTM